MTIDQQLMDTAALDDHGFSRWTRVIGMMDADPPDQLREHIEKLIEQSPKTPEEANID